MSFRLLPIAFAGMTIAAAAFARDIPAPVAQALARAGVPQTAAAIVVEPVDSGPSLVSHRADEAVNPASVMKLVTSYAALELLGPAFTFRTDFLVDGTLSGGVLTGDLVIRAGGDPKLTYERLWQVAHQLRAKGLREIRGDIVIDRAYFALARHDPARFDNDPRRAYNVGPDAFLVNFQAVDFAFVPDGEGVRVTGEPDLPSVQIASRLRVTAEPCGWWPANVQPEFQEDGLMATVVFSGTYPAACGEKHRAYSVLGGAAFSEAVLRWVWSESGGVLRGKVRAGATPERAKLLHRYESEPLANLVRDMNKNSNNVLARHLFLALSAERGAAGDTTASERVVREWLRARRIDAAGLAIENGAGLSRSDRISAGALAALLRSAWSSPVMPELASSLPVFATDGTLKLRRAAGAAGQAHLKGGTLTGVQSIAGYVLDANARRWVVVMVVNHANANAAQPALDALVEWVYAGVPRPERMR
jgi:D-alanyl-D-alanine carboxypeptidase/D-alanyl-D-alanine-endopeptidase (penicillin-binding protein 4)